MMKEIIRENYLVEVEEAELYVDNEARGRSGHMSHAMTEFAPNCFIDFNANNSACRCKGHSQFGTIEYRISRDSGKSYSEVYELPLSRKLLWDGMYTMSIEKAVTCDDGTIIAFCLKNTQYSSICCEPWSLPFIIKSEDEGMTWGEPENFTEYRGRVYDAVYHEGIVYALMFCNQDFLGEKPEHVYRLYTSRDNGKTFEECCVLPFDYFKRAYGSLLFDAKGVLHAYVYNEQDELNLDHAISNDNGKTWTLLEPCYVAKGMRNPQTAFIDGVYILHGRGLDWGGLVVYTSEDGYIWDEGTVIAEKRALAYYSNNINLKDEKGNFLLIQYSAPYAEDYRVNVMHQKLRIKRESQ